MYQIGCKGSLTSLGLSFVKKIANGVNTFIYTLMKWQIIWICNHFNLSTPQGHSQTFQNEGEAEGGGKGSKEG